MYHLITHRDFATWRQLARRLLVANIPPEEVMWADEENGIAPLLAQPAALPEVAPSTASLAVPRDFVQIASTVSCHRDPDRWNLLYRLLWRLTGGDRHLLDRLTDDDVIRLNAMERAVRRDRHKMTAFVRFRLVEQVAEAGQKTEHFVAWHRPDHYIVRLTAPFFSARFASLNWTILTPDDSAAWNGSELSFGPGVPESQAPRGDDLESLWRTYYANIFNPARVKISAMKREMPVRHWPTLPETDLIPELLQDAPRRVQEMIRKAKENARPGTGPANRRLGHEPDLADKEAGLFSSQPGTEKSNAATLDNSAKRSTGKGGGAEAFIPTSRELSVLAAASKSCRGCHLCDVGTQTVFGEGRPDAAVVFVGEQPGDQEGRIGRPFVGPAGQLLDEVLSEVGIIRDDCYVTNTVKHFKWEPRGNRRIHAKPGAREVAACLPWLETELAVLKPKILICLGSTAAQALLGRDFRVTERRGQPFETSWAPWTIATIHPSALLRIPDAELRATHRAQFVEDLRQVAARIKQMG